MSGPLALPERIAQKIEPEPMSGCWLWSGRTDRDGYGRVKYRSKTWGIHRLTYELLVGPIEKPTIDHLCRMRCCCNPAHLRPATVRENILAEGSQSLQKQNASKTHCPTCGTELRRVYRSKTARQCPVCVPEKSRIASRAYKARYHDEILVRRRAARRAKKLAGVAA